MFEYKFKVYIENVWFDSLYDVDYYYDKRIFFATGAKQFFTIYQILKTNDFHFTIIEEKTERRFKINSTEDFRQWIEQNYISYLQYLDNINWANKPSAKDV